MQRSLSRTIILMIAVASLLAFGAAAVACSDDPQPVSEYRMEFSTDGGTEISPIVSVQGGMIVPPAAPRKTGYTFVGWYTTSDYSGAPVEIPNIMPSGNVTYYAKFALPERSCRVIYTYNLGVFPHDGIIDADIGVTGDEITVKDGSLYNPQGGAYKFIGWSSSVTGKVSPKDKLPDQYDAGDKITLAGADITLYAQWARLYTDSTATRTEKVYIYEPLIEGGLGASILVRDGEPDKYGFVAAGANTASGYNEFEFYMEESDGASWTGRLNADFTYTVADGYQGKYLYYDYIYDEYLQYVLAMDGFGFAIVTEVVGAQTAVRYAGYYSYQPEYSDFHFEYIDYSQLPSASGAYPEGYGYYAIDKREVVFPPQTDNASRSNNGFDGIFTYLGEEAGTFIEYGNGELNAGSALMLSGYGNAVFKQYDMSGTEPQEISSVAGTYRGTAEYVNIIGEYEFIPDNAQTEASFKFIIGVIDNGNEKITIYTMFDEGLYGTFKNGSAQLYLDGYGMAEYDDGVSVYGGECTVSASGLVTFVPMIDDGEGNISAGGKMFFNITRSDFVTGYDGTFSVNAQGFAIDSAGNLSAYEGDSKVIAVPSDVKTIGADAFNYTKTDVSLASVTLPASVTSIGARAFENNHTLRRAVFESATPITIDFAAESDPFRWPAGDFKIVVPQAAVNAYKAAWTGCSYEIIGDEDVLILPEFVINDGVLTGYNKQPNAPDLMNIEIPAQVTEIAANVFRGLDFVQSVDLNNVTIIGANAFAQCANLVSVKFTKVQTIGDSAFASCIALTTGGDTPNVVNIPEVRSIGVAAFAGCYELQRVILGASLQSIGNRAFYECSIYENRTLWIVISGSTPPTMGAGVTTGNIIVRIVVTDIAVAKLCYNQADWTNYCRHLYIQSGAEKGRYYSGAEILAIDGRAVFAFSDVWLYEIAGETIKFYSYQVSISNGVYTGTLTEFTGTYNAAAGTISVTIPDETTPRTFRLFTGAVTYSTADGKYTLECNPMDLQPENYENFSGTANVKFNGAATTMLISGYNTKIIRNFRDSDGEYYDIKVKFTGEVMTVTRTFPERVIANITAADGSVITLHYTGTLIYVYGEIKIVMKNADGTDATNADGTPRYLKWTEASGVIATVSGNTYTFVCRYLNTKYTITAKVSSDSKTFTYTYTVQ